MPHKHKPHKGVAKRFKVTATGKLKHRHELSTHLRSGRSANKKRHLGRPAVLYEGLARNLRRMLGLTGRRPNQLAHERVLAAREAAAAKK
jgi:large subunit ribosomal protein L35